MRRILHLSVLTACISTLGHSVVSSPTPPATAAVAPDTRISTVLEQGFAVAVQKTAPAVVNISSSKIVRSEPAGQAGQGAQLTPDEELLQQFFGPDFLQKFREPRERRQHSLGSGVIVNSGGYILTNYHVIEDARVVTVALPDKREFVGKVVGSDPGTDVAVLKIDADHLASVPFADSSQVQVGDIALAIGNPFGIGRTVTMGIVSATGRGGLGIEDYEDFIQTDASINPGNSGGALTNVRGELIGLSTAILSPSGGSLGIGFAVPSNMARKVMDEIVRTGKVTRGYMGVVLQDVTPDIAAAMKLGQTRGALLSEVLPNSPASQAGLQAGDVITEANGNPIADQRVLQLTIGSMAPGARMSLHVQRNGALRIVSLALGEVPRDEIASKEEPSKPAASSNTESQIGVSISDLTPQIRQRLNMPETLTGAIVAEVLEGSAAAEAGLLAGDVIQEANRKPVASAKDFTTHAPSRESNILLLRVNREGHSQFIAIK